MGLIRDAALSTIGNKSLVLRSCEGRVRGKLYAISRELKWGSYGNEGGNRRCLIFLQGLVKRYSGPHGIEQWAIENYAQMHVAIWDTLNEDYGSPVLREGGEEVSSG